MHEATLYTIILTNFAVLPFTGQSFLVLMCSDGFVSMYSLPELKLVCREDCVDASDAFGQRNFTVTSRGLFVHLRSPSEFTRGSITEQARMNLHFSIPTKSTSKLALQHTTPKSLSKDQLCDAPVVSVSHCMLVHFA